jgi:pyruvate/2-oxoglutarate dehydrogenase complex dihydrolipoamide acyltransferase (E2) component
MPDFVLPDLGEGLTEAEIDRWLVKEGDTIAEDAPLVEVITDKATAEIPSPFSGVVSRIHVQEGDIVPVGSVLVTIGDSADAAAPPPPPPPAAGAGRASVAVEGSRAVDTSQAADDDASSAVKAMPPVRKLAREMGVDLRGINGSGPDGRILREDVESAAGGVAVAEGQAGRDPKVRGKREKLRGVRRTIAERMTAAHTLVPAVTHVEECDVTELEATRRIANERTPDLPRLTPLPFVVKAVATALKEHPSLNASLDDEAGQIVFHDRCDIGIAVDTPAGLVVPVVRDADQKGLRQIASEIDSLAKGAREQSLGAADLRDATFTVTSPGKFGGLMATPIVMHPQSAILGVHKASERPVVRDGQIVIRTMLNLSITFDHRILDGMTASKFVLEVAGLLEHPGVLMLED